MQDQLNFRQRIICRLCVVVAVCAAAGAQAEETATRPEPGPMPVRMVLEPPATLPAPSMARSLATSPRAPLVAVASTGQVLLYNTTTLDLLGIFPFPEGEVHVVRFSRDGRLLLAGGGKPGASGKVVVWDITTGERAFAVGNEPDVVAAADISADNKRIALGGPQKVVRVFATDSGAQQYEIAGQKDSVLAIEFSPDGKLLATSDRSGGLHLWEIETGKERAALPGHTGPVTALSWRGDSQLLASASEDSTVRLWEPEKGAQTKSWDAKGALLAIRFTRDGRLVTCGRDQITRVWDQEGKQLVETPAIGDVAVSVAFCDESLRAITGSWAGVVQVYKSDDAALLGTLSTNPPMLAERLAAANEHVKQKTDASAPLAEAVKKGEADLAPAQTALTTVQQEAATFQKNVDAIAAEIKQITDARAASDAEKTKAAATLVQVQQAHPFVGEALRHLTEALGKSPDDAALKEAQAQLTEKLKQMDAQIAELQAKGNELTTAIAAADEKLKEPNTRLEAANKELAAAAERVKAAEANVQQLTAALDAAKKAAEPSQAELALAQQEVQRWQKEITFRDQMTALASELEAARKLASERKIDLDKANEQLAAAQTTAAGATTKLEEASKNVDAINAKIAAARAAK